MPQTGPPEFPRPLHPGDLTPYLNHLLLGNTLDQEMAAAAFEAIMTGTAHHAEVGALLALLATRQPTIDELTGAATVMRRHVDPVKSRVPVDEVVDTAGTGGAPKTFNVSTAAAIVAASAGAKVAKHGNRSRTGRGSAEVLQALGVNVDAPRSVQARCLEEAGVCFCFAVHHHPAAKHAMPVRRALGFPTIFNLLGPLTNPAGARRQLLGVYNVRFVRPVAEALARLGAVRAMVVHSDDGLDELSIGAPTLVAHVEQGRVREERVDPVTLGLAMADVASVTASSLEDAARLLRAIIAGDERGPAREMTLLNAAATLLVAGRVRSLEDGVVVAVQSIDFGDAQRTLELLVELSGATL